MRACTPQQSVFNRKAHKTNSTGYKGVSLTKSGKFSATIGIDYKNISLGVFDCAKDAAKAYNIAALKYFGEFAKFNVDTDNNTL